MPRDEELTALLKASGGPFPRADHRAQLLGELADWHKVWPDLPTHEAREFFLPLRAAAVYLLERR